MKYTLKSTSSMHFLWLGQEDGMCINYRSLKLVATLDPLDCLLMGRDENDKPIVIPGVDLTLNVNCKGGISVKGTWPQFEITNWHGEDKEPRRLNGVQSIEIRSDRSKDKFAHVVLDFAVPSFPVYMNVRTQL